MTVLPEAVLTAGAIGASPSVGSDDTSVSPVQSHLLHHSLTCSLKTSVTKNTTSSDEIPNPWSPVSPL